MTNIKATTLAITTLLVFATAANAQDQTVTLDITSEPAVSFRQAGDFVKLNIKTEEFSVPAAPDLSEIEVKSNGVSLGWANSICRADSQNFNKAACECAYEATPSDVSNMGTTLDVNFRNTWNDPLNGVGGQISGTGSHVLTHDPSLTTLWSRPRGFYVCGTIADNRPIVDAGPDLFVHAGTTISFSSIASDPNNDTLTYNWKLVAGIAPNPTISDPTVANPILTIPANSGPQFTYRVTVSDGRLINRDEVTIVVSTASNCNPESSALMPSSINNGSFIFTIPAASVCPDLFFIDPPVAAGYEYHITGAKFTDIKMPSYDTVPDPDGYTVYFQSDALSPAIPSNYNGVDPSSKNLRPGESYSFSKPLDRFVIRNINPDLELAPTDGMAFPLGIELTNPTGNVVTITQRPLTKEFPLPNYPLRPFRFP